MSSDYGTLVVRSSAILTGSYVAGNVLGSDVGLTTLLRVSNQLVLLVDLTIGDLTSAEIKVEFSDDGLNWYQESFGSISAGTDTISLGEHTFAATGKYFIPIRVKAAFIRVSAKGTGTATNSLLAINAIVGNT
jgi:hypothetical protein